MIGIYKLLFIFRQIKVLKDLSMDIVWLMIRNFFEPVIWKSYLTWLAHKCPYVILFNLFFNWHQKKIMAETDMKETGNLDVRADRTFAVSWFRSECINDFKDWYVVREMSNFVYRYKLVPNHSRRQFLDWPWQTNPFYLPDNPFYLPEAKLELVPTPTPFDLPLRVTQIIPNEQLCCENNASWILTISEYF